MNNNVLEVKDIAKHYQSQPLIENVSFSVRENETICLLGPSGGGKSTLLRIIAGLEEPERGQVFWKGSDITLKPPHLRNFSLMFQDYALFPHLTVNENIAFGLRMKKRDSAEMKRIVKESLTMVRMEDFGSRRVTELSGGEQQRVALARALAPQPDLLMLDEPLGALDRTLREHLMAELRQLLNEINIPVIYVTHDQQEAFTMADRLLILHDGQILQSGSPYEVYSYPASPWLAEFFGFENHLAGTVVKSSPLVIDTQIGEISSNCGNGIYQPGDRVVLVIKPDAAEFLETSVYEKHTGKVVDSIFSGDHFKTLIEMKKGTKFEFRLNKVFSVGEGINFSLNPDSILCFGIKR